MNQITTLSKMSTKEVSGLTGKQHSNVIRDTRNMLETLESDQDSKLNPEQYQVVVAENGMTAEILLDKELTMTLITGYSIALRNKVIKRWQELEEAATALPSMTPSELIAEMAKANVLTERKLMELEQHHRNQTIKNDQFETQLRRLELDTRNGVPTGYLSRKQAHTINSRGLSREVFEQVLTHFEIEQHKYIHTENGHSSPTYAWKEDGIADAITAFLDDAEQVSRYQCMSKMLGGKRFSYVKGSEAAA